MAKVYLKNNGKHDVMLNEKSTPPGGGRIVPEAAARVAMASYPDLEIVDKADADIYRFCKVTGVVPWRGGQLKTGAVAWFADGEYRRLRDRLEIVKTALDD